MGISIQMVKHKKIYYEYFNMDEHYPPRCELTGRTSNVEFHHIDARGMGGRSSMDHIDNIMCLIKEAHLYFGDITRFKPWLKQVHSEYMNDGIPFVHRGTTHEFMDAFLEEYTPGKPMHLGTPYVDMSRAQIRGYLYSHLGKVAEKYLHDVCGYGEIKSKEHAIEFMKEPCGFYDIDPITEKKNNLSIATGDYKKLVYFVQQLYITLYEAGQNPSPPNKNWKNGL